MPKTARTTTQESIEEQTVPVADASPQPEATQAHPAPTYEEIERRAYEIFLERGGNDGNDIEDWLQAERELMEGR